MPPDGGEFLDEITPILSPGQRAMTAQPPRATTRLLVRPIFVAVNAFAELLFPTAPARDEKAQKDRHSSATQASGESLPIVR